MSQLRIISHKRLENTPHLYGRFSVLPLSNICLQRAIKGHLHNVLDKDLAKKIILSYVKIEDNIAVTSDIKTVLDVLLNASVKLKAKVIDVYALGVAASGVASFAFIYFHDDIMPISMLIARSNRHEYIYAPVLLKGAKRIHETLLEDSK